uniref:DNA-directed RNA polymerase subunit n=1 Tax=Nitzschia alba TaxID=2858 RepID=A0A5C0F2L3_NITAL|nr:DNA-directed RNA polymerase beta chain [Nitzschia alba]QEI59559.1 DNA-directed RNA polymerase beta chain [Nitzschia alba]
MIFKQLSLEEFDFIKVKLASPARIFEWGHQLLPNGRSVGEVTIPDTLNQETLRPIRGGLFCEQIFGPTKHFKCYCSKPKTIFKKILFCERCELEITDARVRSHRMGYIKLKYPIVHFWYLSSSSNFIALLLETEGLEKQLQTQSKSRVSCEFWDKRIRQIKISSIIYASSLTEPSLYGIHWDLQQYRRSRELGFSRYPEHLLDSTPIFLTGPSLIYQELKNLNLNIEIIKTRCFILLCTKILNKEKSLYTQFKWSKKWEKYRLYKLREQAIKRTRILENLNSTGSEASWMVFSILPVVPPALRPLTQIETGRFISADLNELYQLVILRNNRITELLRIGIPEAFIRNERRLLQETIDSLIDNCKCKNTKLDLNDHPLKSLSDTITGKEGRFRHDLLGKRVDFSGRSVIVVEPRLNLLQCGLPYDMAIELFKSFILTKLNKINQREDTLYSLNIFKQDKSIIIPILNSIFKDHPIFINRAPTLHRLGIQAFKPILIQGKAIKLHPLVCSSFNADFDGDQMAIHIPLSWEAQEECNKLMLSTRNIISPANNKPTIIPSQDMILGCSYLTLNNINKLNGSNHYFSDLKDVLLAYEQDKIEIHSSIWIRLKKNNLKFSNLLKIIKLQDDTFIEYYKNLQIKKNSMGEIIVQYLKTTTGRAILNYTIQEALNTL